MTSDILRLILTINEAIVKANMTKIIYDSQI